MSKDSIQGKIKTILEPEKEVEELNEKRVKAAGFFIGQHEIEDPDEDSIKKVEGLLNDMRKRVRKPDVPANADDRRFGPK